MRAVLLAFALMTVGLALLPTATAYPCEVPGCQVGYVAQCFAENADDVVAHPSTLKQTVRDCTTVPA